MNNSVYVRVQPCRHSDAIISALSAFCHSSTSELSNSSSLPKSSSWTKPPFLAQSRNYCSESNRTANSPFQRRTGTNINFSSTEKWSRYSFIGNFLPKRILTFSTSVKGLKTADSPPPPMGLYGPPIHIHNEQEARVLVHFLKRSERRTLMKVLTEYDKPKKRGFVNSESEWPEHDEIEDDILEEALEEMEEKAEERAEPVSPEQLKSLFIVNALPFVGFGFLDNMIMIIAGEYIDSTLGVMFGLSTMAAAGIGNLISDACGVGLAHYVEIGVSKMGFKAPGLTSEQWDAPRVRRTANTGKVLGLIVGCIIGMFPLIFYNNEDEKKSESESESDDPKLFDGRYKED